ncbi:MAG: hypothetical protein ACXWC7_18190 [Chitinophagaceae bacterium]
MTKKEKEVFDAAILRAETLAALRWTMPDKPDIPIPKDGMTTGWLYSLVSRKVYEAWSHSKFHGDMPYMPKYEQYKNGAALYSTKARALAALRHAMEEQAASDLLAVDKRIGLTLNNYQ